ncbi:hypothetical protein SAMN05444166_0444 [Singulisphaera sp. GP187]|nr:hypothetical protein SAMN05444166_0444 [Singulisphaera sp. GP187]
MGRELCQIQRLCMLLEMPHECAANALAHGVLGNKELVDMAVRLNVGEARDDVVELCDKRTITTHSFYPSFGVIRSRGPRIALFFGVMRTSDFVNRRIEHFTKPMFLSGTKWPNPQRSHGRVNLGKASETT